MARAVRIRSSLARFPLVSAVTGEQARWGLENLNLDGRRLEALGFAGVLRPFGTSCADHLGAAGWARIHTWDGGKWVPANDWLQADEQILKPMIKTSAEKYATDKKIERRAAADCQS